MTVKSKVELVFPLPLPIKLPDSAIVPKFLNQIPRDIPPKNYPDFYF